MTSAASTCHHAGGDDTPCDLPWSADPRGDDKTALLKYARENAYGVPVMNAVRAVVAPDAEPGDADHRLGLRFYRDHPDLFKTDRRDGFVWVEPRVAAFHLTASKQQPKPGEGGGVAVSSARGVLGRRRMVSSDGERASLLGALGAKRSATEDEFVAFEDRADASRYLLVPFATRFNSSRRVADARERFAAAFEAAAGGFGRGVVLTLTTDPSRFESVASAASSLMDDVNRLKSWLASRFGGGSRPPSVVVPEFTESGLPHVHVAVFGLGFVPHAVLAHYWDARRDRARVVWCDGIASRGGEWVWTGSRPERADGRGPRAYLGKTLGDLAALASASPEEVLAAAGRLRSGEASADDAARGWWKLACYWVGDLRLFTVSPSLREGSTDDGSGEGESRWRFVGVARYGDFPSHVREGATLIRRERRSRGEPPPSGGVA